MNVGNDNEVHLILKGVSVHNETGAALYCKKAKKVTVTLAEGEEEPDATVFAKHDLVITGSGTVFFRESRK